MIPPRVGGWVQQKTRQRPRCLSRSRRLARPAGLLERPRRIARPCREISAALAVLSTASALPPVLEALAVVLLDPEAREQLAPIEARLKTINPAAQVRRSGSSEHDTRAASST